MFPQTELAAVEVLAVSKGSIEPVPPMYEIGVPEHFAFKKMKHEHSGLQHVTPCRGRVAGLAWLFELGQARARLDSPRRGSTSQAPS